MTQSTLFKTRQEMLSDFRNRFPHLTQYRDGNGQRLGIFFAAWQRRLLDEARAEQKAEVKNYSDGILYAVNKISESPRKETLSSLREWAEESKTQ